MRLDLDSQPVRDAHAALVALDTPTQRDALRAFAQSKATDPNRWYRWLLWWAVPPATRYALADANPGMTDAHLDTLLRNAVPDLI